MLEFVNQVLKCKGSDSEEILEFKRLALAKIYFKTGQTVLLEASLKLLS